MIDTAVEELVDKIGAVLDGQENAIAVHALITSLAVLLLMSVSPSSRNTALVFIVKTLREMVKNGTNAEKARLQ